MKGKTTVCQLQCFFGLRNKTWPFKYLDKFSNMGQGWECWLWGFCLVCETVENVIRLQRTKAKSRSCFKGQYQKNQNIIKKKNTDKSQCQYGILWVKNGLKLTWPKHSCCKTCNYCLPSVTRRQQEKHSTTNLCWPLTHNLQIEWQLPYESLRSTMEWVLQNASNRQTMKVSYLAPTQCLKLV